MTSAKSLQEAVYGQIFPGGMIPVACKDNISAIDARIREIEQLAKGVPLLGEVRRLTKRNSLALTDRIIELRESCSPPMGYKEIMRRLGNVVSPEAARNRYDDAVRAREVAVMQKEGYAAISGEAILAGTHRTPPEVQEKIDSSDHVSAATKMIPASEIAVTAQDGKSKEIETVFLPAAQPALRDAKPLQIEDGTIRESQIVQESEEVKPDDATLCNVAEVTSEVEKEVTSEATKQPQNSIKMDLTQKGKYDRYAVPVPDEVADEVFRMYDGGLDVRRISETLTKKGILIDWRRVRGIISNAGKKNRTGTPQTPDTSDVADTSTRRRAKDAREEARKAEEAALRSAAAKEGFGPLSDQARATECDPAQPEAAKPQSLPGAEGAQDDARANPRGTPEEKPKPKSISRADLNIRIWDAYQAGDSVEKISADLNLEGYYYDERQVRNRLKQQGAEL